MKRLFDLPAELRTLIWQQCLPEPRHIKISARRQRRHKVPTVLHLCHESRMEAQRHYDCVPAVFELGNKIRTPPDIWIDFSKDTLCVEGEWSPGVPEQIELSTTLARVQSLAFEFCSPQNFMQLLDKIQPVQHYEDSMRNLREVVLYSGPKKWFEDSHGRVQLRDPPLEDAREAAKILVRLLHMLFGGHAWLDNTFGIPPPLRWQFVVNEEKNVWAGPFPREDNYDYVFRCARTGRFEIQNMTWEQLGRLKRVQSSEPRVHDLVGSYENCPEHQDDTKR